MTIIEDLLDQIEYERLKIKEIKKIVDRFKLFETYTQHNYDCAFGDIREITG